MNTPNSFSDGMPDRGEISLVDIVNFLAGTWKKLVIAAATGAILGLVIWYAWGSYTSEYILLNNANTNVNTNTYALDLVSWKTIQKSLPNLASQKLAESGRPEDPDVFYKSLANEVWWQKNVIPGYAITKSDTKDLVGISKDLDSASTTILSLTINAAGKTKEQSLNNVRTAADFLRTGGAYLQLRNILNSYEGEKISAGADIKKKITAIEIEMSYLVQRAKALEVLHKRFPGNVNSGGQMVDVRESGAKYLPISTQIIAIYSDIDRLKEELQRYRNRLSQIELIKTFLIEASPLAAANFNGLELGVDLLKIEEKLRASIPKDDVNQQEVLDRLHYQLLDIQARFTKGLEANTAPISSGKKGMLKSVAGGLVLAFFLMLMALIGQRVWIGIRSDIAIERR